MPEIPNGALRLVQAGEDCHAFIETNDAGKKQLRMKVYSGGVIKNHWYWQNLVIDLKGLKFSRNKYPILENHNTDMKIGFTGKPIVDGSIVLNPKKTEFVSTEESKKFQETSAEGFPYQASMYVIPSIIEKVEEGASVKVNGITLKGPGTVWRKSEFQEASICVFGWDKQTESSVFSKERDAFKKTIDEKEKVIDEKEKKLGLQNDRVLKLEKNDSIRAESELQVSADSIWAEKLSGSDIPEHLYDKVKSMINHSKFVKEGVFGRDAFAEAIDAEIKDWIEKGVVSKVMGTGFTKSDDESAETLQQKRQEKEDDEIVKTMLSHAGQEEKSKK